MVSSLAGTAISSLILISSATAALVHGDGIRVPRAATIPNPLPGLRAYKGCYIDDSRALRALSGAKAASDGMTAESCISFCDGEGFIYAGIVDATECYCGNSLTVAPNGEGECSTGCGRTTDEACRGTSRLAVFYSDQTAPAAPIENPGPDGWLSLGCFSDSATARTLSNHVHVPGGGASMTVASCTAACREGRYKYAGVEDPGECYCGDEIQNEGASAAGGCDTACNGNSTELCGGPNRLNLYRSGSIRRDPDQAVLQRRGVLSGWTDLGCYNDSVAGRTLTVEGITQGGPNNMTEENCQAGCAAQGYPYAGVEFSSQCFCDSQIQNGGGPAPDGDAGCNMGCSGDQTEMCGGPDRLNVYFNPNITGPVTPPPPAGGAPTGPANFVIPTDLPSGWSYAGCYHDNDPNRNMLNEQPGSDNVTVESCIATCVGLGYSVAGIEFANQCFCDDWLRNNASLSAADTECSMSCSGNASEACGGPDRLSVYNVGNLTIIPVPTVQTTHLPGSWKYVGCLIDNVANRDLPYQTILDTTNNATTCLSACSDFGFGAGGMEFGQECYCGDAVNIPSSATFAPDSDCNEPCTGNPAFLCGAGNRMSYYTWQGEPLQQWTFATGADAGIYEFLIGGVVVPLMTTPTINGKVTFLEKAGTGAPNTTGAYEFDPYYEDNFDLAWREMHVQTDIFCSAGLVLPDKAGRQLTIGGWADISTFGIRLYIPSGVPGVNGTTDWQENSNEVKLQNGRWYPSGMVMTNGSILVVGGERGSNDKPVPTLELLPSNGPVLFMDWLNRTDPYNLYPFLAVVKSGIFVGYYNEARILDENTFETVKVLPKIPGAVNNAAGGRNYPLEGTMMLLPQHPPYNPEDLGILICGGSTPFGGDAIDNCVTIYPESENPEWILERMPSKRVMSCMTALPDGTYLILNGAHQGVAGFGGLATDPNFNAVLYDPSKPVNQRMTVMANTTIARLYHSEAVLMVDGRVLVTGSDPQDPDHFPEEYRVEVFRPPYLLSGLPRPSYNITEKDWSYGGDYSITVNIPSGDMSAAKISLIGAESSTHGNSMGQRTIFPAFSCSGTTCTITAPPDAHTSPPGWHKLFVLDGPTPSVAQFVRIGGDPGNLGNWPDFPDFTLPGVGPIGS